MEQSGQNNNKGNGAPIFFIVDYLPRISGDGQVSENVLENLTKTLDDVREKTGFKVYRGGKEPRLIYDAISDRAILAKAEDLYNTWALKNYIKTGKRAKLLPVLEEKLDQAITTLFDRNGHLVETVLYDNKLLFNCIIEAFYLELKKIKAEKLFRQSILNILAANSQEKTALYARILNDKTTRG